MDVLQRKKIHVAIEFVICGKKIFEGFMFAIVWIAIAGAVGIFEAKARFRPDVTNVYPALKDDHVRFLIEAFGRCAGAEVAEIAKLIRRLQSM